MLDIWYVMGIWWVHLAPFRQQSYGLPASPYYLTFRYYLEFTCLFIWLADTNTALDTKSAKKNKKQKTKKPGESNKNETKDLDPREMLAVLREKLEEAKAEKVEII